MSIIPANPLNLAAQIKLAESGDTVLLDPGNYSLLSLTDVKKQVTIAGQPSAILTGVKLTRCLGLTFQNLYILASVKYAIEARDSQSLAFHDNEIRGPVSLQPEPDGSILNGGSVWQGFYIKNCVGVSIQRNSLSHMQIGIGFAQTESALIADNRFSNLAGDAIRGGGRKIQILRNVSSNLYKLDDNHVDFVQFAPTWGFDGRSEEIEIADNIHLQGAGWVAQGIFMRGLNPSDYIAVEIRSNVLLGLNHNGIYVTYGEDIRIENNWLRAIPGSNPGNILMKNCVGNCVILNNSTSGGVLLASPLPIVEGNAVKQPIMAAPYGAFYQ